MPDADQFKYLIFCGAGVVIVVGSLAVTRSERTKIRRRLGNRRALTDSEFHSLFPTAGDAAVALVVRNELKGYLQIPVELVHPDDKLCAELGLAAHDGLDANFFVRDVERVTGIKIPDVDAEKMYTLRDIVSYVSAKKEQ
jgi:acyl carrier protein